MSEFKDRSEQDRRQMNRKWGELANKMGTLVEDIVAPNLPRVAKEVFDCPEPSFFTLRPRKRKGLETLELDALVVCEKVVLLNETKSSLNCRDVDDLAAKLEVFSQFFPEYEGLPVAGVLASLSVDPTVVQYATKRQILVLGMGDETMVVLNPEAMSGS